MVDILGILRLLKKELSTDKERKKEWQLAEDVATMYLKKEKHYKILERNFKTPFGEIDIIASHKGKLIFVEVKSGNSTKIAPAERVDFRKYKKMLNSAEYFINQIKHNKQNFEKFKEFQIDVIEIRFGKITHYEDVGWDFN
ncbi:MAG: YraN family protein [Fervidobacterium sp.]